jgi:hypothetical protein
MDLQCYVGSGSGFATKTGRALSGPALYESPDRRRGFYAFLKCRFLFMVALTIVVRSTACRLRKYSRVTMVSVKLIIKPIIANPFYLSILLSSNIDTRVAAQVLIGFFTLEIVFARIDMPFVLVIKIVLVFILGHDITSPVL